MIPSFEDFNLVSGKYLSKSYDEKINLYIHDKAGRIEKHIDIPVEGEESTDSYFRCQFYNIIN